MATVKMLRNSPWRKSSSFPSIYSNAMIYSCITTDLVEIFHPFQSSFFLFFSKRSEKFDLFFDHAHWNFRIVKIFKNRMAELEWIEAIKFVKSVYGVSLPFTLKKFKIQIRFPRLIFVHEFRNSSRYLSTTLKIEDFKQKFLPSPSPNLIEKLTTKFPFNNIATRLFLINRRKKMNSFIFRQINRLQLTDRLKWETYFHRSKVNY